MYRTHAWFTYTYGCIDKKGVRNDGPSMKKRVKKDKGVETKDGPSRRRDAS